MIRLTNLLLIGSISLTSVTEAQETISIKKGDKAQFNGYLMPIDIFTQVNADLDAGKTIQVELEKCRNERFECITGDSTRQAYWFGAGAALATVLVIALRQK